MDSLYYTKIDIIICTFKKIDMENWFIFWGIWEEAELILRIWGAKENTLGELRYFLSGIWGDQCIMFREHRPPRGLINSHSPQGAHLFLMSCFFVTCWERPDLLFVIVLSGVPFAFLL